jgi:hypothetical protein
MTDAFDRQRGHLFPWVPVAYGIGIGIYFALGRTRATRPGRAGADGDRGGSAPRRDAACGTARS